MRKLVTIREVKDIQPIKGADRIEVATVGGWDVVVKKGEVSIGEKVLYFEIDSFLPIRPEFEFLRKSCYKKMDGKEGFRLKTIRLRNTLSQGLVLPLSNFPEIKEIDLEKDYSEDLGVIKYEKPVPAQLAGKVRGYFPSFLRKSDEERIQNLSNDYEEYKKFKFFVSEKLDGTSFTCYLRDGEFGVCSRNLELSEPEPFVPGEKVLGNDGIERDKQENTYWKIARENDLKNKLINLGRNIAIQGEIIGEGIQENRYGLKGHKLFVFNIFDIDKSEYVSKKEKMELCSELELETVPVIKESISLPNTIKKALEFAENKSVLNENTEREGLVWVSIDSPKRISFKTISNKFLAEGGD
jgi:RNA ligase (TIGR02306 family)